MDIVQLRHEDIDDFLALASAEGWICDRWELEFLLARFPRGCLAAFGGGGPVGYVTAIKYGDSGWIGNLIVRRAFRGKGVGSLLMERALKALADAGVETVWLTASKLGKPVYEKLGFVAADVIHRWSGEGIWGEARRWPDPPSVDSIRAIDRAGWGDERCALIEAALRRGRVHGAEGAFLISQPCGDALQAGPWGGDGTNASLLLDALLLEAGKGTKVVLDVPIRNTGQTSLLLRRGFSIRGSTLLMWRGKPPAYAPEYIGALASMGSMG